MMRISVFLLLLMVSTYSIGSLGTMEAFSQIDRQTTSWERMSPMPTLRIEMTVAAIGDTIYAIGGIAPDGASLDKVEAYNTLTDTWTEVTPLPIAIHHPSAISYEGILYVIGGYTEGFVPSSAVFMYDPRTDSWSRAADMSIARGALTVEVIDGIIYAVGGASTEEPNNKHILLGINEAFDPVRDKWETKAPMPMPREHLASGTVGGKMYVIGGRTTGGVGGPDTNLNINEEYDPVTDTWRLRAPMPSKRGGIVGSSTTEAIFIFGGEQQFRGTFWNNEQYLPASDTWTVRENLPTPRHGHGAATIGRSIYVIGGGPRIGLSATAANERFNVDIVEARGPALSALLTILIPVLAAGVAFMIIIGLKRKTTLLS